jgi:ribosomal protein S18 acetylase RimI-like enzyme
MGAKVRRYEPGDRSAIRRICCDTGFMGEPADWYWRDRESFADIWTSYYTDGEPESSFVVEMNSSVVGYLAGCVDSSKTWDIRKIATHHAIGRLCIVRPGTAGFLRRTVADVLVGSARRSPPVLSSFHDPRWPSHLHINLDTAARRSGCGRALMNAYLEYLRGRKSPGCHIETLAENSSAVSFFRATGFVPYGNPQVVPGERTRNGARLHRQILVQAL